MAETQSESYSGKQSLKSLQPQKVLEKLNLTGSKLAEVRSCYRSGDEEGAFTALLEHYRQKFPLQAGEITNPHTIAQADKICRHIFQWGPYPEEDYGADIDWAADPAGDIEWVAAIYRFFWARPLAASYQQTKDEKYAQAFVELATDWIAKHPLENRHVVHPVYTYWKEYPWLDIQTGIRATNICSAFKTLVHSKAFTPQFLRLLLASLYDHQMKTKFFPMNAIHNKAVFEQRGFVNVAFHFDEFSEAHEWAELAMERARANFLAQTTSDGVQREWSYGYHQGVLTDAVEIKQRMESMGVEVPTDFSERIRQMYDYIFAVATPDLGAPMFGDASRPLVETEDRSRWQLYDVLVNASKVLGDPKYEARATLDRANLPEQKSYAFEQAGMYVMRNDWGPKQIHFGLHCSPEGISSHDQPDNGTFELYAYGRWLMPDTGFYTYGHDKEARAWHRQTRVHQTLTLDGQDTQVAGRHLLWHSDENGEALVVENESYKANNPGGQGLTHRRTVWFVDRKFFVLYDEALGDLPGQLSIHFQFAPGEVVFDSTSLLVHTNFPDANVLVVAAEGAKLRKIEEEGWFAWSYGHRKPRQAVRFEHSGASPQRFLTVVVPYQGVEVPETKAWIAKGFPIGADHLEVEAEAFGQRYRIGRDLQTGKAWYHRRK